MMNVDQKKTHMSFWTSPQVKTILAFMLASKDNFNLFVGGYSYPPSNNHGHVDSMAVGQR